MRAIAPTIGDDEESAVAARALSAAATIAWLTGNATEGLPWAARALRIWQRRDEADQGYEALDALAMSRLFSGQLDGVEEMMAQAIEQARRVGDFATVAFTEGGAAQFDAERGDLGAARARLTRATEAAARSANPSVVAFTALSEGRVAGFSGDLDTARRAFDRAIDGYRAMRDWRLELVARSDLAHAVRLAGNLDEAQRMYRDTLHDWVHAGNRGAIANQLESVAAIAVSRGELVHAARLLGAAEAIREAASAPMLATERRDYDAMVERVRDGLEAPTFRAEWASGRAMGVEEAVALALGQPRT
jgi:tetratricopeptide (TPR) repeat protein